MLRLRPTTQRYWIKYISTHTLDEVKEHYNTLLATTSLEWIWRRIRESFLLVCAEHDLMHLYKAVVRE